MATITFGGFETGDLSEMSVTFGSPSAQSTNKRSGAYAVQGTIGATGSGVYTPGVGLTEFWWRTYQYITVTATPSAQVVSTLLGNEGATGDNLAVVFTFQTDGSVTAQLQYNRSGGSGTNIGSSFSVPTDQWDIWEGHLKIANPNSIVEIKLNGAVKATGTGLTLNDASSDALRMGIPDNLNGLGGAIRFDDWSFDNGNYPGEGRCILRAGRSQTPTHDDFSKTGGTTIVDVWRDVPFSATTFAASTAESQAQTMFVDDLTTGLDACVAGSRINACSVVAIGKTLAGTTGTYALRRRLNSSNTDEAAVFTSSDSLVRTAVWTAGHNEIKGMEVGVVRDAGGDRNIQIEDVYLSIDYSPATPTTSVGRIVTNF